MIVGVMSDTHGQAGRAGRAVALLKQLGAEAIIHCGDVGSDAVFDQLAGTPAWFVWGNTDEPEAYSPAYLSGIGITPPREIPTRIELAGREFLVFHGHEPAFGRLVEAAHGGDRAAVRRMAGERAYVLYGHSHIPADAQVGDLRLVNPGALQRARVFTVATIDIATDTVEHWRVEEASEESSPPRPFRLR